MAESTVLSLADLDLPSYRIIERVYFKTKTTYLTQTSNNLSTQETISGYTPGWYMTQLSFGPANTTNGQARLIGDSSGTQYLAALSDYELLVEDGPVKDTDLLYLDGEDLLVQSGRYDSSGTTAMANLVCFGWLIHE